MVLLESLGMHQVIERETMQQFSTTLTQRGQVTLPAEVRRILGVKPKEKVTFQVDGEEIRLVSTRFTVESVRGSVPSLSAPKTLEEIYQVAGDEHARHIRDEMNRKE